MTQHVPYNTIGAILHIHAMVNGVLAGQVEDVPDERMAEQPATLVNHPAWTLSHLNAYAGMLLMMLDDPSVRSAAEEMARFGYGTTPTSDRSAYASKHELLEQFHERNARVAAVVGAKHADYFPRPAPAQYLPNAPTIGHLAITLLVAHPPHHLGQLRQWRRAGGFKQQQ